MIEFALMAPILLLVLGGIVYAGAMIVQQERLAIVARHVARHQAIESTEKGLKSPGGLAPAPATVRNAALAQSPIDRRGVALKGVNWSGLKRMAGGPGQLKRVNDYVAVYKVQTTINTGPDLQGRTRSGKAGIGVVFHGVTVHKDMKDLQPIGRLASIITPGVSATSVMPQELPPKGKGGIEGVLELNQWITDIVNEPVKDR